MLVIVLSKYVPTIIFISGYCKIYYASVNFVNVGSFLDFHVLLCWDDHLNNISSKVHFILHGLFKFAYLTPERTKIKIVKSLILPYFLYVDVLLGCPSSMCIKRLNVIFNSCIRYVCNIRRRDHVSPYSSVILGCTLVKYLKYRNCLYMYNLLTTESPS